MIDISSYLELGPCGMLEQNKIIVLNADVHMAITAGISIKNSLDAGDRMRYIHCIQDIAEIGSLRHTTHFWYVIMTHQ